MAARVAREDAAVGIDDALIGTEQAVDVAVVAGNPGLAVRTVALSPSDGAGLVISKTLERKGVEDHASGEDNGVRRAGHAARDAVDDSTVRRNSLGGDTLVTNLDLGGLAGPQVLDIELSVGVDARGLDTDLGPGDGQVSSLVAAVQDCEDSVIVGHVLGQDIKGAVLADKGGLLDKRILVNSNEVLVGEELDFLVGKLGDVGANEERGREAAPECKVSLLLLQGVLRVVSVEEVGVVEETRALVTGDTNMLSVVGEQTVPSALLVVVGNIVRVASKVAVLLSPAHNSVPVSQVVPAAEVGRGRVGEDHGSLRLV